jgi:hypothetical protein
MVLGLDHLGSTLQRDVDISSRPGWGDKISSSAHVDWGETTVQGVPCLGLEVECLRESLKGLSSKDGTSMGRCCT